jgi:glycerophosphoryl diester phosphodiesterase
MVLRLSLALCLVASCGDSSDGGPPDATPALPGTGGYLSTGDYDCTAAGPFVAPSRPHAADCFADLSCDAPLVAGHRIANPFAPENSLSGLRAAILLGVDIVETDVRVTSDGVPVLLHDGDVDRTTNGTGAVDAMTLAELQALHLETETDDPAGDFSCDTVPTLDDVFALARGQIVVELEAKGREGAAAAAQYLSDNDLMDQAFILCDDNECEAARAAVADVPIMTRPNDAAEVDAKLAYDPGPILVHIDPTSAFLTDEVVSRIHAAEAKVYANAFLVGDAGALASHDLSLYRQMFDDGLDVIQAEYPHWALQALGRLTPDDSP